MLKVLILDPKCLHYRVDIYDYFFERFLEEQIKVQILYDKDSNRINDYKFIAGCKYDFKTLKRILEKEKFDVIISHAELKYISVIPFIIFARINGVKTIIRAHGINLSKENKLIYQMPYHIRNLLYKQILLYSKHEIKYIKKRRKNILVANNTLNYLKFTSLRNTENKKKIKLKYNIKSRKIILFSGRIIPRKKLDLLLDMFIEYPDRTNNYALAIVGGGINESQKKKIEKIDNIVYFGEVYDKNKLAEIFSIADIFCIPGWSGLSINHAFYYSLPYVTFNCQHAPEINYLKDGINGRIVTGSSPIDLLDAISDILEDPILLKKMSKSAKETLLQEASIEGMFQGYHNAILDATKQ
jgi:glycosyltransferase involved in cell wall biosynthesis